MSEQGETPSLVSSETPQATTPTNGAAPAPLVGAPPAAPTVAFENLKFPEGVEVDKDIATGLLGILNDQALEPAARAQGLVDLHLKAVESASEKASQFYRDLQDEWVGETVKEVGGEEQLKPILANIALLVDEYGGNPQQQAELRDLFALTGAGNSPRMVGFLNNVAKVLVKEGKLATGGGPAAQGRTAAEILYPNMIRG